MDGGSTENPDITPMENLGCLENNNTYFIFTTIIWSLILLLSFLLNATLLLAFIKRPGLRIISNRFVMNLSASNLLTIILLHPLLITDHQSAPPSAVHCTLAEGATALVTTSSILSVLLIAIDQYLAVIDPLHYRTRIDNLKCTLLIIVVWILSIIISVLAIFNTKNNINSHSGSQQSLWQNCRSVVVLPVTDDNNKPSLPTIDHSSLSLDFLTIYNLAYTIIYIIIIYLAPFITIIWIYLCIYTAAHNNSERTRRTGSRPVLTVTNYLTDDDYLPLRHDSDSRIKNISSLSSIDESIEITSQLQRHLSPSPIIEEDISNNNNNNNSNNNVIFTVGSHNNDIKQFDTKEINEMMENSRPYNGHIGDFDPEEINRDFNEAKNDLEDNERNTQLYIGHIEENGKLYGIDEAYGDLSKDATEKLSYIERNEFNEQEQQQQQQYATESDSNGDGQVPQNAEPMILPKIYPRQNTRTTNYINSLRHRISNGSLFKYREETRAARISALVIVMGFVCWTPFFTIVVIKTVAVNLVYHQVDVVGIGCFLLGTIVSPMLFGYRSRRIKRELRKLFCFRRELAYKNNRSLMAKKVLKRRNSSFTWGVDNLGGEKGGKLSKGFWSLYRGKVKEPAKVQFIHVPETALTVDTCRSSFSSGASTQISSTSTDDS
ncbi:octopamine receptor 2 isoform X2 [Cotesia glomerata]|uniref:octopamine receptor 2 isoform X2 n=1 Tax=Cotesia glomerata TaxID=32391 RepID=UPI001D015624|nr:octopamine receptor 2 isoform X2 [Cotesia glomerata]